MSQLTKAGVFPKITRVVFLDQRRGQELINYWWRKTGGKSLSRAIGLLVVTGLMAASVQGAELKEMKLNLEKAKLALSEKRYEEAAKLLEEVVAAEPDNTDALRYLGLAQMGLKDFKAAEQSFAQALAKNPSWTNCRLDHVWALVELKRPDAALAEIESVLAAEPENARGLYLKGQALLLKNDYAAAAVAFQNAASLDPAIAQDCMVYLGVCQDRLGQTDLAREALLNAQALDPASATGQTASAYLERLEKGAKPGKVKRVEGSLTVLYQNDSNVATVADERMLPEDVSHKADSRMVVLASVLGRPLLTDYWTTEARYTFYGSRQFKEDNYNLMVHQGLLGGYYRTLVHKRPLTLRIQGLYQWAGLGKDYDYYSTIWRVIPSAYLQETDRLMTEFSYYVESETFEDPGEGDLDRDNRADQILLAQYLGFLDNRVVLKLAGRFIYEDANGRDYDVSRMAGMAELRLPLWSKARALAGFEYEYRDYFNNRGKRRDEIIIYSARLEQEIIKHLTLYGDANFNDYNSTLSGFDYDRNIYSAGLIAWY